jgi:hypothetical protein
MHTINTARPITRARAFAALVVLVAATCVTTLGMRPSGAASSNSLSVTAGEYVYQLKGAPKPGWVTVNFKNAGTDYHMLALFAVKPGVTVAQLKQAVASNDDSAFDPLIDTSVGDHGDVSGAPTLLGPKQATTTTTQLAAGHYGMMCFFNAPDGTSHAAHGMIKVFDVKGAKSTAKPPTTQGTVTLNDDGIDFPLSNPGHNLSLKITNAGTTPHSFTLFKINAGKTPAEVKAYFDAKFNGQNPAGDPPAAIVGGMAAIAPGTSGYLQQTLATGHYGYVSTEGDDPANDDSTRGLIGEFDVK